MKIRCKPLTYFIKPHDHNDSFEGAHVSTRAQTPGTSSLITAILQSVKQMKCEICDGSLFANLVQTRRIESEVSLFRSLTFGGFEKGLKTRTARNQHEHRQTALICSHLNGPEPELLLNCKTSGVSPPCVSKS